MKSRGRIFWFLLFFFVMLMASPRDCDTDGYHRSSLALTVAVQIAEGLISPANDWGASMAKTPEWLQPACQDGTGATLSLFQCSSLSSGELEQDGCPKFEIKRCWVLTAQESLLSNPKLLGAIIDGISHPCQYLSRRGDSDTLEDVSLETIKTYITYYLEAKCNISFDNFPDIVVIRFENQQRKIIWQFVLNSGELPKFGGKRASFGMLRTAAYIAANLNRFINDDTEIHKLSCNDSDGDMLLIYSCLSISYGQIEINNCPNGVIGRCWILVAEMFLLGNNKDLVATIDAVAHPCKYIPNLELINKLKKINSWDIFRYNFRYEDAKCDTNFNNFPDMVVINFENEYGHIVWQFIKMPSP
jgi:hypothetical protein